MVDVICHMISGGAFKLRPTSKGSFIREGVDFKSAPDEDAARDDDNNARDAVDDEDGRDAASGVDYSANGDYEDDQREPATTWKNSSDNSNNDNNKSPVASTLHNFNKAYVRGEDVYTNSQQEDPPTINPPTEDTPIEDLNSTKLDKIAPKAPPKG